MQKVDLDRYEHDPKYRKAMDLQFVQEDAPLQDMSIDMMFMAPAFNTVKGTLASSVWTGSKLLQPTKTTLRGWGNKLNGLVKGEPTVLPNKQMPNAVPKQAILKPKAGSIQLPPELEAEVQRRLAKKRLIDQYGNKPTPRIRQKPISIQRIDEGLRQLKQPRSNGKYPSYLTRY